MGPGTEVMNGVSVYRRRPGSEVGTYYAVDVTSTAHFTLVCSVAKPLTC